MSCMNLSVTKDPPCINLLPYPYPSLFVLFFIFLYRCVGFHGIYIKAVLFYHMQKQFTVFTNDRTSWCGLHNGVIVRRFKHHGDGLRSFSARFSNKHQEAVSVFILHDFLLKRKLEGVIYCELLFKSQFSLNFYISQTPHHHNLKTYSVIYISLLK